MAELMYGSGLRLTELLRLRIKDVDVERRKSWCARAKGDKDRVTVLPESWSSGCARSGPGAGVVRGRPQGPAARGLDAGSVGEKISEGW